MKQDNSSSSKYNGTVWQNRGVLDISISSNGISVIEAWINDVLQPISLPVDFLKKIRSSAHQAVEKAFGSESPGNNSEHIHLRIYCQDTNGSRGQTWGFFRIEKAGHSSGLAGTSPHIIDFYLYLES